MAGIPLSMSRGQTSNACAKTNGARLFYKGDGFSHTDPA